MNNSFLEIYVQQTKLETTKGGMAELRSIDNY